MPPETQTNCSLRVQQLCPLGETFQLCLLSICISQKCRRWNYMSESLMIKLFQTSRIAIWASHNKNHNRTRKYHCLHFPLAHQYPHSRTFSIFWGSMSITEARLFMKYWFTSFIVSCQRQRKHEQLQWGHGQRSNNWCRHFDSLSDSLLLRSVSVFGPVYSWDKQVDKGNISRCIQ